MNTYLVTGAAGFIGAAIAKKLINEGNKVVTIDNLSTGLVDNIPQGCTFIKGNIYDEVVLEKLNEYEFQGIIHMAGQSSGEVSFSNPVYDLQTNTQSTIQLLNIAKQKGIKHFVYASSMSVYGDQDNDFVTEQVSPCPKSFYAVGKLASEHYMRIYSGYGIQCTALRFFNVYGVGQNMKNLNQGMASIYLAMAIKDKHIMVKGSKDRFRDFVYIDDVVDAVLSTLNQDYQGKFQIFNVSTGKKQTVEQVIAMIQGKLPYNVSVEYIQGTPGDQKGVYGDNSKIKKELNWEPRYNFEEGMDTMIKWAQELEF